MDDKKTESEKVFLIKRLQIAIGLNVNLLRIELKKLENELAQPCGVIYLPLELKYTNLVEYRSIYFQNFVVD